VDKWQDNRTQKRTSTETILPEYIYRSSLFWVLLFNTTNFMKLLTPVKAMRAKCLDCMCGVSNEVKLCTIPECPIYPYRFGRRPEGSYKKRILSPEKKKKMAETLKKARESRS